MTFRMIALAAALGLAAASATAAPPAAQATTPAAAKGMNYDCTKAGNKNKAACKNVTPGGVAAKPMVPTAAKPAAMTSAAKPAAMATATKAPAKPMNYDCTKAGNKNKAVCKNVVAPPAMASAARPAAAVMPVVAARASANAAARTPVAKGYGPNEVAATLKNGKVVHYDCSKAGNKDKKACGAK